MAPRRPQGFMSALEEMKTARAKRAEEKSVLEAMKVDREEVEIVSLDQASSKPPLKRNAIEELSFKKVKRTKETKFDSEAEKRAKRRAAELRSTRARKEKSGIKRTSPKAEVGSDNQKRNQRPQSTPTKTQRAGTNSVPCSPENISGVKTEVEVGTVKVEPQPKKDVHDVSLGVEELKTNASKSKTVSKLGLKRAAEEIEIPTAKKAKAETQPKAEGDMYIPATEVEVGVQPTTEAKKAAQETKSPAAEKAGADTQRGPGVKRAAEDTEIPAAKRAKLEDASVEKKSGASSASIYQTSIGEKRRYLGNAQPSPRTGPSTRAEVRAASELATESESPQGISVLSKTETLAPSSLPSSLSTEKSSPFEESYPSTRETSIGLKGGFNLCYLNAVLQMLVNCDDFVAGLKKPKARDGSTQAATSNHETKFKNKAQHAAQADHKDVTLSDELRSLAKKMWADEKDCSVSTAGVKLAVGRIFGRQFCGNKQQDAAELLELILDRLDAEDVSYEEGGARKLFGGTWTIVDRCLKCKSRSKSAEPFDSIRLNLPSDDTRVAERKSSEGENCCAGPTSLPKCLNTLLNAKMDNACDYCGAKAIRRTRNLSQLPQKLVLTVNRVGWDTVNRRMYKTHAKVRIPPTLTVKEGEGKRLYKLCSIIEQKGDMVNAGHYTTYIKRMDKWYLYDNEYVIEVDSKTMLEDTVPAAVLYEAMP